MATDNVLEIKNLHTYFYTDGGVIKAVDGVDVELRRGATLGIVGESGSGKSVTSLSVMGLLTGTKGKIADGEILLDGDDIVKLTKEQQRKLRGSKISMIFQEPMTSLNPVMKIGDQVAECVLQHEKISKKEALKKAEDMLRKTGVPRVEHMMKEYPFQLSGGQRQRVAFARALAPNPELLLLDEPFAAIDAKVRQELRSWLREMITRVGITSIFVTHDQDEAIEVADEIIITNHGHIEQAGTPIEIYSQPKTPFVTEFMGSPTRISNITSFHGYEELGEGLHAVVRPEHVSVTKKTEQSRFSSSVEEGVVERVMFRGREVELHVRVHDVLLVANRRLEEASITEGERVNVFIYQVFAFPAGENGTQNVNIVENANIETEKLFYI